MFSTKAQTLRALKNKIKYGNIESMAIITHREWAINRHSQIKTIKSRLRDSDLFIVRSSCLKEDSTSQSNAGAFLSIPNVEIEDIENAIDKVFDSYNSSEDKDEVLIQPMLDQVCRSGVMFSHDPNTSSPYRIINWSEGNDTSQITGGKDGRIWQQAANTPSLQENSPNFVKRLISLCEELLVLFEEQPIDVEFAFTNSSDNPKEEKLWLLQVRPLILH